jgi:hypothetical protein
MRSVLSRFVLGLLVVAGGAGPCAAQGAGSAPPQPPPASVSSFLLGPPPGDGPVVVRASFHLRDVNEIDDQAETFEFEGVMTLTWRDERQAFDPAVAGVDEKIFQGGYQFNEVSTGWFPQMVLVNESGSYEKYGVVLRVRPDGTTTLIETIDAVAEADLDLRRYPFDRQRLDAVFEVLGFDTDEVALEAVPDATGSGENADRSVRIPQWSLEGVSTSIRDRHVAYAGRRGVASAFVVRMDLRRQPLFMLRLVVLPLGLMVILSWSVFWMERSSLGDRINVSFIGILTAVAYQIVVSEVLPHISYVTLMNGFLQLSFLVMCATVVVNLVVGSLDKRGEVAAGDRVDRRCRWIFPLVYFGLLGILAVVTRWLF